MIAPLTFRAASTGCPSTDPIIDTRGIVQLEQFLPSAVEATCADPSTGVVGLNISLDSRSVVSDFASASPLWYSPTTQMIRPSRPPLRIQVRAHSPWPPPRPWWAFLSASELNVNSDGSAISGIHL